MVGDCVNIIVRPKLCHKTDSATECGSIAATATMDMMHNGRPRHTVAIGQPMSKSEIFLVGSLLPVMAASRKGAE
jgi:hypothetical protein